jgi:hypothetical protein
MDPQTIEAATYALLQQQGLQGTIPLPIKELCRALMLSSPP